ncbi:cyanase [Mucilaginibacter dorajii]|uniref:Cyanate hydratase n=1 Tax=Mucilaginibacter dorajii TaxID=692994 RepID=A0ABP7PQP2_9SPHI|nr:cyanase [Mucilaginibacter dorajii]MCS3737587.1 cyanate lyase [Mucilaginibacter dorajii]
MDRKIATPQIIETLKDKKMSYQAVADAIGKSLVWTTLALHGQAVMDEADAETAGVLIGLNKEQIQSLQEIPLRGSLEQTPPTDPTQYRFYELLQVYSSTLKAVINEKFGDGIMSAIDFTMDIDRVENPNGDRVKITMEGKFLPFKKW